MTHVAANDIGALLDNYADAIEGGNTYRGSGTAHAGIPGIKSHDRGLVDAVDSPITASGAGSTTTIVYASGTWAADRWAKEYTPGFFALCTSATNAGNVDKARRITNWTLATTTFTTDAFPYATAAADVFTILQGFKRIPNGVEIDGDADEYPGGFDRFFHLRALPGSRMPWSGDGTTTFQTELELRLRLEKNQRALDEAESALSNLAIIRSVLPMGTHRDGTLARALIADSGQKAEIIKEDKHKIVVADRYTLVYRISASF